jgi:NADPH:quinone reductase-like Zn-dependent oxidoreductase
LRNRALGYKINLTAEISKRLLLKFAQGILHPVIDRIFDWEAVAEAHNHMESNANIGKIVLKITQ